MTSLNKNKKKCSVGTVETCMFGNTQLYTAKFVKQGFFLVLIVGFFTYNQQEMNYRVAKKYAPSDPKQSSVCSSYEKEFQSYYSLQQHRRKEHGGKQRILSDTVADLNKIVEE